MSVTTSSESRTKVARNILKTIILPLCLILSLLYLALKIYLASPYPAAQLSRLLTSYLQQRVQVSAVQISGTSLLLREVSLANPADFPKGNLVYLDSLVIAPNWWALLHGRKSFCLIDL